MNNDASAFFSDFATDCTVGGVACKGVFDENYGETFGIVTGTGPSLLIEASVTAAIGAAVVIGSQSFTVRASTPDAGGFQLLKLEAA